MKKSLLVLAVMLLFVTGVAFGQVVNTTNAGSGPYTTIQAAIANGATQNGDVITVDAGTYAANEAVTVSKSVTIQGINGVPTLSGVNVTANNVTLQSLKVTGASGSGVLASGVTGLTLTNVESDNNGKSGFDLIGVSSCTVTSAVATGNHDHGLAVGRGASNVTITGGTFTGNGQSGTVTTGSGIIVYEDQASTTTSSITIDGTINTSTNTTAGINISCDPTLGASISGVNVGDGTNTITANNNGSTGSGYGNGGAAVLVYGNCSNVNIDKVNCNNTLGTRTAGLVVIGTDNAGANSPSGVTVSNCTLTGFDATSPAGTMKVTDGASNTLICTNDVDARVGNDIVGFSTGFQVEDALVHKMDDATLGLFRGPGVSLFVTPNSGSIQRAVTYQAASSYTIDSIYVEDGTYAENVVAGKAVHLVGQGANTIIKPASGAPVDASVTGVTFDSFHLYLDGAFSPANTPTFTNNSFTFRTQAKVYLQGPYTSAAMATNLGSNIPLSQPYNVAPFNYAGTETVASVPANVVDWVLVQLRSGTAASTATSTRACFLMSDGTIDETDGTAGVWETVAVASGYDLTSYVVVMHRNHLAVMSASTMGMPNASAYDFTTAQTQAYGTSPMATVSGAFAMWSSDYNNDGQVTSSDFNQWNADAKSGLIGYARTDFNLDAQVTSSDFNQWNANAKSGAVTGVPN